LADAKFESFQLDMPFGDATCKDTGDIQIRGFVSYLKAAGVPEGRIDRLVAKYFCASREATETATRRPAGDRRGDGWGRRSPKLFATSSHGPTLFAGL